MSPIALNNPMKKINKPTTKPINHTKDTLDASSAINPNSAIPPLSKAPNEIKATTKGIKPRKKNRIETFNDCNMLTKCKTSGLLLEIYALRIF